MLDSKIYRDFRDRRAKEEKLHVASPSCCIERIGNSGLKSNQEIYKEKKEDCKTKLKIIVHLNKTNLRSFISYAKDPYCHTQKIFSYLLFIFRYLLVFVLCSFALIVKGRKTLGLQHIHNGHNYFECYVFTPEPVNFKFTLSNLLS